MTTTTWIKHLLEERGVNCKELHHREAFTARDRTVRTLQRSARGEDRDRDRRRSAGRPCAACHQACRAIDRALNVLHVESVRMATEREIADYFPDCEPGAVPPLRHWNARN